MSRVPVTRRKMMKMLMILSRDRSNHTTIYAHGEEDVEERRGRRRRSTVSKIQKRLKTSSDQTHGETWVLHMRRSHLGSKRRPLGPWGKQKVVHWGAGIPVAACTDPFTWTPASEKLCWRWNSQLRVLNAPKLHQQHQFGRVCVCVNVTQAKCWSDR